MPSPYRFSPSFFFSHLYAASNFALAVEKKEFFPTGIFQKNPVPISKLIFMSSGIEFGRTGDTWNWQRHLNIYLINIYSSKMKTIEGKTRKIWGEKQIFSVFWVYATATDPVQPLPRNNENANVQHGEATNHRQKP